MTSAPKPAAPAVVQGVTVYDEATNRFGTVADTRLIPGRVWLRPIGGGYEWCARREHIRPALASELLAERLRSERTASAGEWS